MPGVDHNIRFPDGERIKAHIKRHKVAYSMGVGIGIGVVVTLAIRKPMVISIAPVFNNGNDVLRPAPYVFRSH